MTNLDICTAVHQLKNRYCESNPFLLCKAMGILLMPQSMGTHNQAIKGFFMRCKRIKSITVNSDLPKAVQNIVVAHELGHATLHQDKRIQTFHDVCLFSQISHLEREANLFAAELLLDDHPVLDTLLQYDHFFTAASVLEVPNEILDFKLRIMKAKGYSLAEVPFCATNDFMSRLEFPKDNY